MQHDIWCLDIMFCIKATSLYPGSHVCPSRATCVVFSNTMPSCPNVILCVFFNVFMITQDVTKHEIIVFVLI